MDGEWDALKKVILAESDEKVNKVKYSFYKEEAEIKTYKATAPQSGTTPCYLAEGIVKCSAIEIWELWWQHGNRAQWDEQISTTQVLRSIDESSQLIHSCTYPAAGGLISPREFVDLLFRERDPSSGSGRLYYKSVEHEPLPSSGSHVRAWNHASCVILEPVNKPEGGEGNNNDKAEQQQQQQQTEKEKEEREDKECEEKQSEEKPEAQPPKELVVEAEWCKVKVYSHLDIKMWWLPTAVADPAMTKGLIDTIKGIRRVMEKQ